MSEHRFGRDTGIDRWLSAGSTPVPDGLIDSIGGRVRTTPQRRAWLAVLAGVPAAGGGMSRKATLGLRLAIFAALLLGASLAIGLAGSVLLRPDRTALVTDPSPTPIATDLASPSPAPSKSPTATREPTASSAAPLFSHEYPSLGFRMDYLGPWRTGWPLGGGDDAVTFAAGECAVDFCLNQIRVSSGTAAGGVSVLRWVQSPAGPSGSRESETLTIRGDDLPALAASWQAAFPGGTVSRTSWIDGAPASLAESPESRAILVVTGGRDFVIGAEPVGTFGLGTSVLFQGIDLLHFVPAPTSVSTDVEPYSFAGSDGPDFRLALPASWTTVTPEVDFVRFTGGDVVLGPTWDPQPRLLMTIGIAKGSLDATVGEIAMADRTSQRVEVVGSSRPTVLLLPPEGSSDPAVAVIQGNERVFAIRVWDVASPRPYRGGPDPEVLLREVLLTFDPVR